MAQTPFTTQRIHVTTAPGFPLATVKRELNKTNVGLYCQHCGEFFAFAVEEPSAVALEFTADAPLLVQCPFCKQQDHRNAGEILRFPLTEGKKRRKPTVDPSC
ncbi:hypothetical protein MKK88_01230 [Methylobacterium sp. E-005]|uniref:hypothetical protein n=1 Tax=Methylobacterium sp. E-005 TaxID=2836549 RepID=UPI001FBA3704|nr:hypothetical protein [Methylobacterium sp. E-005]MCJ2084619.1 hypothetical protein [Methylobacterium sp. E-005]